MARKQPACANRPATNWITNAEMNPMRITFRS